MRPWSSGYLAFLACFALTVSALPGFAWICPMTGQVLDSSAAAAKICAEMRQVSPQPAKCPLCARASQTEAPTRSMKNCCKPLSWPVNDNRQPAAQPAAVSVALPLVSVTSVTAADSWLLPALQPAPLFMVHTVKQALTSPPRHWQPPPRSIPFSRAPPAASL